MIVLCTVRFIPILKCDPGHWLTKCYMKIILQIENIQLQWLWQFITVRYWIVPLAFLIHWSIHLIKIMLTLSSTVRRATRSICLLAPTSIVHFRSYTVNTVVSKFIYCDFKGTCPQDHEALSQNFSQSLTHCWL